MAAKVTPQGPLWTHLGVCSSNPGGFQAYQVDTVKLNCLNIHSLLHFSHERRIQIKVVEKILNH